jgi:hypothetical protein
MSHTPELPADQPPAAAIALAPLDGTEHQVEWGERIRTQVQQEFARVEAAFRSVGGKQGPQRRTDTEAILSILEEKRLEVMGNLRAGYFIHEWQELDGKVREMIGEDERFQAIQAKRKLENGGKATEPAAD